MRGQKVAHGLFVGKGFGGMRKAAHAAAYLSELLEVLASVPHDGWDLGWVSKAMVFSRVLRGLKKSEHQAMFNLIGKGLLHYYKVVYPEPRGFPGFEKRDSYLILSTSLEPGDG